MKKVLMMAIVALAACSLKAESYLYWMVGDNYDDFTWNSAKLYAVASESSPAGAVNVDAAGGGWIDYETALESKDGSGPTALGQYASSDYYYFVELLSEGNEGVARSEFVNYATLAKYISAGTDAPASGPYAFTGFAAIPEPTSGLLLMLGLCGLALKRKRV